MGSLSEVDTQNLLLDKEPFDIHEIIKNVAASFEGRCKQKKISIELVPSAIASTYPLMEVRGERKSWETFATNFF